MGHGTEQNALQQIGYMPVSRREALAAQVGKVNYS